MPEVWFPYGGVETLVTIQAENLGAAVEPVPEDRPVETQGLVDLLKGPASLVVCDFAPTTVSLVKSLVAMLPSQEGLKVLSGESKKLEGAVSELKGRVVQLDRPIEGAVGVPGQLADPWQKVFVSTARPDPLYGIVDARIQAALNWLPGASEAGAGAREDMEPTPFEKTDSFDAVSGLAGSFSNATFASVVPRGGKVRQVFENAPFDAVKQGFLESNVSPSRGLIIGPGGKGFDDTFSSALRTLWGSLGAVRRGGEILMVCECGSGMGSQAMEMLVSGRLQGEGKKRDKYVPGLEEVYYLSKLKEEYGVMLLSGLPEVFAKGKLGLSTARGSGEAVGRLLNKLGRTAKVNLVSRASECRITAA